MPSKVCAQVESSVVIPLPCGFCELLASCKFSSTSALDLAVHAALLVNEFLAPRWSSFRDAQGQLAGTTLLRSHGMHVQVIWCGCRPTTAQTPFEKSQTLTDERRMYQQAACTQTYWVWLGVGWCIVGWTLFSLGTWVFHAYLHRALGQLHLLHRLYMVYSNLCV